MKDRTSFAHFFPDAALPTPTEVVKWTVIPFGEWKGKCNGREAYSDIAPAMLSVAVIREQRLHTQIAELEAKLADAIASQPAAPVQQEPVAAQPIDKSMVKRLAAQMGLIPVEAQPQEAKWTMLDAQLDIALHDHAAGSLNDTQARDSIKELFKQAAQQIAEIAAQSKGASE